MVSLFLLLGCNLSYIVYLFAGLHELASASARTLLKLASLVRALLKPYGDTLNKSLHLFETHCAFLPLFNPNIDLLQAVKATKSGHHLSHDQASKGYGSTPCLRL